MTIDEMRLERSRWMYLARHIVHESLRGDAVRFARGYHRRLMWAKRQLRTLRRFSHFTDEGIPVHE